MKFLEVRSSFNVPNWPLKQITIRRGLVNDLSRSQDEQLEDHRQLLRRRRRELREITIPQKNINCLYSVIVIQLQNLLPLILYFLAHTVLCSIISQVFLFDFFKVFFCLPPTDKQTTIKFIIFPVIQFNRNINVGHPPTIVSGEKMAIQIFRIK